MFPETFRNITFENYCLCVDVCMFNGFAGASLPSRFIPLLFFWEEEAFSAAGVRQWGNLFGLWGDVVAASCQCQKTTTDRWSRVSPRGSLRGSKLERFGITSEGREYFNPKGPDRTPGLI